MKKNNLKTLVQLTQVLHQSAEMELGQIKREEDGLRHALADLDERNRKISSIRPDDVTGPRSYGGDVLWQGWVTRTQRDLQIKLAHVLSRKSDVLVRLRRDHGREEAALSLLEQEGKARTAALRARQADRMTALHVLASDLAQGRTASHVLPRKVGDQDR